MEEDVRVSDLLSLPRTWTVSRVTQDPSALRIDIYLTPKTEAFVCPKRHKEAPPYDTRPERVWRHLDCMEYRTYLHARLPRVVSEI